MYEQNIQYFDGKDRDLFESNMNDFRDILVIIFCVIFDSVTVLVTILKIKIFYCTRKIQTLLIKLKGCLFQKTKEYIIQILLTHLLSFLQASTECIPQVLMNIFIILVILINSLGLSFGYYLHWLISTSLNKISNIKVIY